MNKFGIDNWYNYYSVRNASLDELKELFYNYNNNFIFKEYFTTNFKSNFWELEIYTKKDLVFI